MGCDEPACRRHCWTRTSQLFVGDVSILVAAVIIQHIHHFAGLEGGYLILSYARWIGGVLVGVGSAGWSWCWSWCRSCYWLWYWLLVLVLAGRGCGACSWCW